MGCFVSLITHSIIALFNDPVRGNWLYIHSTSDSISSAKSCICHCKSLGTIIFLLFVIPTEASKYSTLALPNWFTTSSEVYTLNCHKKYLILISFFITFIHWFLNLDTFKQYTYRWWGPSASTESKRDIRFWIPHTISMPQQDFLLVHRTLTNFVNFIVIWVKLKRYCRIRKYVTYMFWVTWMAKNKVFNSQGIQYDPANIHCSLSQCIATQLLLAHSLTKREFFFLLS